MDPDDYHSILMELADFSEIDTSTIASTRKSLMELSERREQLLEIQEQIKRDIRGAERYYLDRMAEIRTEIEDLKENSSMFKRIITGNPAAAQAKAMKQLQRNRDALIETYRELLEYTEELLEYTEDLMIELYDTIKSFFG
ncbi:hypothetical protein [Methanothermobacter sp.]|uniref:hypothetical protein n=1 Tax=Methanothermobacter sp. TaxID=1884223 RepID=UPI0026027314|nr:hypothetical protein [Methanothermobacter sp.]MDI9618123.1 hypothetical protein [Methanothermobacter sp.]